MRCRLSKTQYSYMEMPSQTNNMPFLRKGKKIGGSQENAKAHHSHTYHTQKIIVITSKHTVSFSFFSSLPLLSKCQLLK